MPEILNIKKSNCKSCYKCIRHCPVKSIRFSGNQAHIMPDECILCGQCYVVCPQNAKFIYDDTEKAKIILSSGHKVIASVAPSFVANYNGITIETMEIALKKLGFFAAEETAIAATSVKKKYEQIILDGKQNVIISSCCPTVNLMIEYHFPEVSPYLAKVVSPMLAHSLDIKRRFENSKTIFIGPCISKKAEAEVDHYKGIVDCVITFDELSKWFEKENINLEIIGAKDTKTKKRARIFPTAGGILKSMDHDSKEYDYISVDGLENCMNALEEIKSGGISKCFIEMSACTGSCIGGPLMNKKSKNPLKDYLAVKNYTGNDEFSYDISNLEVINDDENNNSVIKKEKREPCENEILNILKQMGKTKPEDELNCGSCGYNTCKEKALAVFTGKADMSMCLPFLKDKAETFSDNIIKNSPNGILLLNEILEVQQINTAAQVIMNIRNALDVLGEQVIRILDPGIYLEVLNENRQVINELRYLAEYNKFIEETIIYDKNYHVLICIMRDVTDQETQREKKELVNQKTILVADKVIEKQMRIVQEIASLLGETTAETKIALTKLKESLSDE